MKAFPGPCQERSNISSQYEQRQTRDGSFNYYFFLISDILLSKLAGIP